MLGIMVAPGYNHDGTIFIKVRDPRTGQLYSYSFILATLLHELTHLSFEGHGKARLDCV